MSHPRTLRSSLRSVSPRVVAGFAVAIVTLLVVSVVTLQALSRRTRNSLSVERTFFVLRTTETLRSDVNGAQLALCEFIITGDHQFLDPLERARRSVPRTLEELRAVTASLPEAQRQLDELAPNLSAALEIDAREIGAREDGASIEQLQPLLMQSKAYLDKSAQLLEQLKSHTGQLLEVEQAALTESIRTSSLVAIAGDALLLALILAAAGLAFRDAAERAHAFQFQRRVLGMVGHDLRNPLSVVMMSATQLDRKLDAGDGRHPAIARIKTAVTRMDRMIRDLLDYSRLELHIDLPLDLRPGDVGKSCVRIVEEFRDANPGRDIVYDPGEQSTATWDFERIEQVLENLVGNALKYSPPDTPVGLSWKRRGDEIELEVKNRGVPIPPSLLPHIFEPFCRGQDRERATPKNSLGLGLYIVHHIVARHGGAIDVRSSETEGTVFSLRLPRRSSAQIVPELAEPHPGV